MSEGFRSGFVAIVGRPNVGKSTLMNSMVGEKIAIISDKPQTTRNRIQCVLTRPNYQIIFIDTPGIHKPKNRLGEYMVQVARGALEEVDVVLFMVDIYEGIGSGDRFIAEELGKVKTPVILVANKVDRVESVEDARRAAEDFCEEADFDEVLLVSALNGTNLDKLESVIVSYLPEGPKYYPDDMVTDQPERFIVAELIREKALELLEEEVPHGIGVEVTSFKEREDKNIIDIYATIYCEKKSHKGIIIGKGGSMLREIGTRARHDIERLLGTHVYLELWVKVKENWRNNVVDLKNLGYN
ncbi:GTP-binding protein Era [Caldicoprobacter guelmensis]|uniref:GTPase Era n=1 Tax=Caldicoprobacter guelmensis TaxID=1170224 RepID=UPI001956084E|nr:GTPase Era [Caldicoprobacter guelmensis]MBM7581835.1 GTP-binding protein Era [Caldicoprobacter guelmensis]